MFRFHTRKLSKPRIDEYIAAFGVFAEDTDGHLFNERVIERLRFVLCALPFLNDGEHLVGDAEHGPDGGEGIGV